MDSKQIFTTISVRRSSMKTAASLSGLFNTHATMALHTETSTGRMVLYALTLLMLRMVGVISISLHRTLSMHSVPTIAACLLLTISTRRITIWQPTMPTLDSFLPLACLDFHICLTKNISWTAHPTGVAQVVSMATMSR